MPNDNYSRRHLVEAAVGAHIVSAGVVGAVAAVLLCLVAMHLNQPGVMLLAIASAGMGYASQVLMANAEAMDSSILRLGAVASIAVAAGLWIAGMMTLAGFVYKASAVTASFQPA